MTTEVGLLVVIFIIFVIATVAFVIAIIDFTAAKPNTDVTSTLLTGFTPTSGTVTENDTILTAFEKVVGNVTTVALTSSGGTTLVSDGTGPSLAIKGLTEDTGMILNATPTDIKIGARAFAKFVQSATNATNQNPAPSTSNSLILSGAGENAGTLAYSANSTTAGTTINIFSTFTFQAVDNVTCTADLMINDDLALSVIVVGAEDSAAPSRVTAQFMLQLRGATNVYAHGRVEAYNFTSTATLPMIRTNSALVALG